MKHSKLYSSVYSIEQIGQGGESVVFRMQTLELDEIVAKCPFLKENKSDNLDAFQQTLYEYQLLKV